MPPKFPALGAIKIVTAKAYDTYLTLPIPEHLPEHAVNREFIVYDPQLPNGPWGQFNAPDFDANYRWKEKPREDRLSLIERVKNDEDA
jgi:hypothetical protein